MAEETPHSNHHRYVDGRLVALVCRYVDDELSTDERAELNALLRADPRARTMFVRCMIQDALLHELLATDAGAETALPDSGYRAGPRQVPSPEVTSPVMARTSAAAPSTPRPDAAACDGVLKQSTAPLPSPPSTAPTHGGIVLTHGSTWWLSRGAVLSLAALAVVGASLVAYRVGRQRGAVDVAATAVAPSATPAPSGPYALRVDSGTAVLTLAHVGDLIAEGPVEFDLLDPMRGRLRRGRIRLRVTDPAGIGFAIETPHGEVTDLGTEFGLDVKSGRDTQLVVFQGAVDLRVADSASAKGGGRVERLEGGEAIAFGRSGRFTRIISVCTGQAATFKINCQASGDTRNGVIAAVSDNLRSSDTKKFYEIVPGGLREDALAFADRPDTEWNGATSQGMPNYLLGADYIKPFNDDKLRRDVTIQVTLARPAKLYVFFDKRLRVPDWLRDGFHDNGDVVGLDYGRWRNARSKYAPGVGPGVSVDATYAVWERDVKEPGVVQLGSNTGEDWHASTMYGIAAVAL